MITILLKDSLPKRVMRELKYKKSLDERRALAEKYLDDGRGKCWLNEPEAAEIVAEALRFYAGRDYRLIDWVVMPNHVHWVYDRPELPIGDILRNWKGYTAKEINKVIGSSGKFWQRDYFDRYARNPLHLYHTSCYVLLNPVKAGLVDDPFDWPHSSIHDYHEEFKDDLRRWYRQWKDRFWRGIEICRETERGRSVEEVNDEQR